MRSIFLAGALLLMAPSLAAQNGGLVVRGLSFQGNTAIDDQTLATFIVTTNSSWIARSPLTSWLPLGEERPFSEPAFRTDVWRVALVYKLSGYFEVQVDTLVERDAESVDLTFVITEGEPTRLTSLAVDGMDEVSDREDLLRDLPLAEGDVFSRFELDATVDTLARRLRNHGYPTATVDRQGRADSVTRTARMTLLVSPGTRADFGRVVVRGNDQVDSAFIASLVTTREGRSYRLDALYRSQRALYSTGLFRYATVSIDSTRFTPGDSVVPVLVEVAEGRSHRVRGSLGYGTNDCIRVGAGWTARNFLGNGRVVDVSGRLSKIGVGQPFDFGAENSLCSPLADDSVGSRQANYGIDVSLRRYAFLSPDNTLSLTLFSERRSEYKVYVREDVGAELSLRRETASQIPITIGYRISYGQTQANAVSFCQFFNACVAADIAQLRERRVLTTLTASATRDRSNAALNPTRGSVLTAEAAVSSRFLGSSSLQQFVRLVGDAAVYVPLSRSLVVAGHLRGGVIFAPEVDLSGGRASFIPPDQRFYAGGPNDVRGYDRNELGPVVYVVPPDSLMISGSDTTYSPSALQVAATGGDRVAVGNVELRFPAPFLGERFRLAAFVDAGALWSTAGTAGLRVTPGMGIRVTSPLGPIRFDVGYNGYQLERGAVYTSTETGSLVQVRSSDRRDRERRYTIHFSIGHAF
jgi:outer membrane protein assembly complex protein YaeT